MSSPRPLLFQHARLVDPATGRDEAGDLLVKDGHIAEVFGTIDPPDDVLVVDVDGLCLAPGLVDMRAQLGEPGMAHKETIDSAGRAAAAGGVTALACLPATDPPLDNEAPLEFVARRAREAKLVKIYCYGAATQGLKGTAMAEIGLMQAAGAVGFTDGTRTIADAGVMRNVLGYARSFDALVIQHPEEPSLTRGAVMNEGELATKLGLPGAPAVAEQMQIERDCRLLELTGGRLHFAHVSSFLGLEAIRAAKARGLAVTCDTAPPYFALTEADIGHYFTFFKLSPPLRTVFDRQMIAEAIADGTIDVIASDHRPEDQDSKRLPFGLASVGGVGLETLLPVALELVHNDVLPLPMLLHRLSTAPARLLGIAGGALTAGAPADLVLFDMDRPWRIDAAKLHSKAKNSPFDGRPVGGMVLNTLVDGRIVHSHADAPLSRT